MVRNFPRFLFLSFFPGFLVLQSSPWSSFSRFWYTQSILNRMRMLLGVLIFILVFVHLSCSVTLFYKGIDEIQNLAPSYCQTRECLRSAAFIKETLDVRIDPCENFYDYVCGLKKSKAGDLDEEQRLLGLMFFHKYVPLPYDFKRSRILGKCLK